jgi:hypothetical protein
MISTESALIDALGGNLVVAEQLGVKHNTVSGWRARGFPPWAAIRLQAEAMTAGIATDPELFQIRRPQRAA